MDIVEMGIVEENAYHSYVNLFNPYHKKYIIILFSFKKLMFPANIFQIIILIRT